MLSNTCKHAIRAVTYIASRPDNYGKIAPKEISEALNIPTPYMAKILQILARNKILFSKKGPNGGFLLMRDAKEISIYDIINATDGNGLFTNCAVHNKPCRCSDSEKSPCLLHEEYTRIRIEIAELFTGKKVDSLVKSLSETGDIEI